MDGAARPQAAARILVVDDEEANLRLMRRILEKAGYENVVTTAEGSDVAAMVDHLKPDLMLLDLHMAPPDGFAILRALGPRITDPGSMPVLVLTGDATPEAKRGALSLGARDFLAKPFDGTEALLRIRNLLETRRLYKTLEDQNLQLETRVAERTSELQQSQVEILERLARASEIRDDETGRHTQRVGDLSGAIAASLGLDAHFVDLIRRAATLHDIGKIGIPDSILLKPGKLTPEEIEVMRTHTVIGARILSGGRSELIQVAQRIALNHHECWDGTGYPNGISGEEIPIEARIVALADCVDALSSTRPYRVAWSDSAVTEEVERGTGRHFDPTVVAALMRIGFKRNTPPATPRITDALPYSFNALEIG
jgi:putative two-component system response regulator